MCPGITVTCGTDGHFFQEEEVHGPWRLSGNSVRCLLSEMSSLLKEGLKRCFPSSSLSFTLMRNRKRKPRSGSTFNRNIKENRFLIERLTASWKRLMGTMSRSIRSLSLTGMLGSSRAIVSRAREKEIRKTTDSDPDLCRGASILCIGITSLVFLISAAWCRPTVTGDWSFLWLHHLGTVGLFLLKKEKERQVC